MEMVLRKWDGRVIASVLFCVWMLTGVVGAAEFSTNFSNGLAAYDRGDYGSAHREWLMSAEAGDAEAQVALGGLYHNGAGRKRDYAVAADWYRRAAVQGQVFGQLNLGDFYRHGLGVKRDLAEAYFWLSLAAGGNSWAASARDDVAAALAPKSVKALKKRVLAWRPRK